MTDLYHYIGDDLGVSATGDLLPVDGITLGQQRVLRRLLTNPGDYSFHPDYGAGLPREVGNLADVRRIQALIRTHIFKESAVARTPEPVITVTPIANGVAVRIQYADADTRQLVTLNFDIAR